MFIFFSLATIQTIFDASPYSKINTTLAVPSNLSSAVNKDANDEDSSTDLKTDSSAWYQYNRYRYYPYYRPSYYPHYWHYYHYNRPYYHRYPPYNYYGHYTGMWDR